LSRPKPTRVAVPIEEEEEVTQLIPKLQGEHHRQSIKILSTCFENKNSKFFVQRL